jgi:hypothetical protein
MQISEYFGRVIMLLRCLICSFVVISTFFERVEASDFPELENFYSPYCDSFSKNCVQRQQRDMASDLASAVDQVKKSYINLPGSQYYCKSKTAYTEEAIKNDGYFFCKDFVDYAAACDAQHRTSCNNTWAIEMHENFQNALNVYSCGTYSTIWTCANCSDAYKRWLCSVVYRKHVVPSTEAYETGKVR